MMSIPSTNIDLDSDDEAALKASKPQKPLKKCNRSYNLMGADAPSLTKVQSDAEESPLSMLNAKFKSFKQPKSRVNLHDTQTVTLQNHNDKS